MKSFISSVIDSWLSDIEAEMWLLEGKQTIVGEERERLAEIKKIKAISSKRGSDCEGVNIIQDYFDLFVQFWT